MTSLQSKSVLVCGGGVIGLCCAYYLSRAGFRVKVVERNSEGADSCVQGSAGYLSPSHVVPLSAPGMVMQGLKWMLNSRSPFYTAAIRPRLDPLGLAVCPIVHSGAHVSFGACASRSLSERASVVC